MCVLHQIIHALAFDDIVQHHFAPLLAPQAPFIHPSPVELYSRGNREGMHRTLRRLVVSFSLFLSDPQEVTEGKRFNLSLDPQSLQFLLDLVLFLAATMLVGVDYENDFVVPEGE